MPGTLSDICSRTICVIQLITSKLLNYISLLFGKSGRRLNEHWQRLSSWAITSQLGYRCIMIAYMPIHNSIALGWYWHIKWSTLAASPSSFWMELITKFTTNGRVVIFLFLDWMKFPRTIDYWQEGKLIFCQNQKTPLLQQGRGRIFGPEQTSEEGDLLFFGQNKSRARGREGELDFTSKSAGRLARDWIGGNMAEGRWRGNMEALRFDKNFLVQI